MPQPDPRHVSCAVISQILKKALMNSYIVEDLARNWWALLVRGIIAILFGILAFTWPGMTLAVLVLLYGSYVAIDGVFALVGAFRGGNVPRRWWLAAVGVLSLLAAFATFAFPGLTAFILILFIGSWALLRGIMEIVGAVQVRKLIDNEWLLVLHGFVSVLFGLLVLSMPGAGALALVWLIASYAIVAGILMIGFSLRLRSVAGGGFRIRHA